jgi:hypothetical protein
VDRGVTRWPFVVIHFPCSVSRRSPAGGVRHDRHAAPNGQGRPDVPTLRGDATTDKLLLRSLPPGIVR